MPAGPILAIVGVGVGAVGRALRRLMRRRRQRYGAVRAGIAGQPLHHHRHGRSADRTADVTFHGKNSREI
jgi:hypothetical protein